MVSTSETAPVANGGVSSSASCATLPPGRYRLVAWDVDTSGRRLIDEICQIAAYTPSSEFAQYVMPFADLNLQARRRHNIRVVTVGRFRMLKDSKTNKVLKTKSEMYALTDFITWLEEIKGDATDGIILMFHEPRKGAPPMLLDALKRFNLLERFTAVVKGFANSFEVAENKCADTLKTFTLKMLARVLLDKDAEMDNATERARLTYQIVQHLSQTERQDLVTEGSGDCSGATNNMIELIRVFARPVSNEINELAGLKKLLECQNTLRPVFGAFLKSTKVDRVFASRLRRLLAENNINYEKLEATWKENGIEGLSNILNNKITFEEEKENSDLLEILECHFDPEKKPLQPKPRTNSRSSRKISTNKQSDEITENGDKPDQEIPDTTSKGESSSETTGNAYSDVGSPISSDNTPRSQVEEPEVKPEVKVEVEVKVEAK